MESCKIARFPDWLGRCYTKPDSETKLNVVEYQSWSNQSNLIQ